MTKLAALRKGTEPGHFCRHSNSVAPDRAILQSATRFLRPPPKRPHHARSGCAWPHCSASGAYSRCGRPWPGDPCDWCPGKIWRLNARAEPLATPLSRESAIAVGGTTAVRSRGYRQGRLRAANGSAREEKAATASNFALSGRGSRAPFARGHLIPSRIPRADDSSPGSGRSRLPSSRRTRTRPRRSSRFAARRGQNS